MSKLDNHILKHSSHFSKTLTTKYLRPKTMSTYNSNEAFFSKSRQKTRKFNFGIWQGLKKLCSRLCCQLHLPLVYIQALLLYLKKHLVPFLISFTNFIPDFLKQILDQFTAIPSWHTYKQWANTKIKIKLTCSFCSKELQVVSPRRGFSVSVTAIHDATTTCPVSQHIQWQSLSFRWDKK